MTRRIALPSVTESRHLLHCVLSTPVAIGQGHEFALVEGVLGLAEFGDRHYAGLSDDERFERKFRQFVTIIDGVAHVMIKGPICWFETWNIHDCRRNPTTAEYARALDLVRADQRVHDVQLYIESPGGTAHGTEDVANAVWRIRQSGKRTKAKTSIMCFSAAAWIAVQCEEVELSPMGLFGSIGAFTILSDCQEFLAKLGFRDEIIRSGNDDSIKGDSTACRITEGLKEDQQRVVDQLGEHFVAAIMRGRGMTRPQIEALHNGRVFMGQRAVEAGLVDQIVEKGESEMPETTRTEPGTAAARAAAPATPAPGSVAAAGPAASGPGLSELLAQLNANNEEVVKLRAELGRQLAANEVQRQLAELGDRLNLGMKEAGAEALGVLLMRHTELKVGDKSAAEVFFSVLAAVPDPALTGEESDPEVSAALEGTDKKKTKGKPLAGFAEEERALLAQYVSDEEVAALVEEGMQVA